MLHLIDSILYSTELQYVVIAIELIAIMILPKKYLPIIIGSFLFIGAMLLK